MLDSIRSKSKSFGVMVIFGIIIVVFVFWGMGNYSGMTARSLATVNGEGISIEEFRDVFLPTLDARKRAEPDIESDPEKINQLKREVLAELIKARLCVQEAGRLGILVTPQEIRLALDSFSVFHDSGGKFNKDIYLQVLAARGFDPGKFEQNYSQELLERKLQRYIGLSAGVSEGEAKNLYAFSLEKRTVEYVLFTPDDYIARAEVAEEEVSKNYEANKESFRTPAMAQVDYLALTPAGLAGNYPVSDEEAEEYYGKNKDSFRKPERYLARHIFISFPAQRQDGQPLSAEEKEIAAKEIMDKVLAELKSGKDFAELARQYSHDDISAQNGGLLEWLEPGQIPLKEFEEAALALKPGQVSQPVRSEAGLHLIRLEDRQEAHLPSYAEAKQDIIHMLGKQKADSDFAGVQKSAEDDLAMGVPLEKLAATFKLELQHTGLVPEKDLEKKLNLKQDSRQLLQDAVASVAAGGQQAGAASSSRDSQGMTLPIPLNIENGIALVRVREAEPSRIPPLETVRPSILLRLKEEKARALARQDAEKALPSFTGKELPEGFKDRAKVTQTALRAFPSVEPLGNVETLLQGIFSSTGEWLPLVYDTPKGPVIARCASVDPVTDEEWRNFKGIFMPQMLEARRNEALGAFLMGIDERARVETNPALLDSLSISRRGQ